VAEKKHASIPAVETFGARARMIAMDSFPNGFDDFRGEEKEKEKGEGQIKGKKTGFCPKTLRGSDAPSANDRPRLFPNAGGPGTKEGKKRGRRKRKKKAGGEKEADRKSQGGQPLHRSWPAAS